MNHKGMVEIPVVTIFTVIAGGLILMLFVIISLSQGESANESIQASSLQRIDSLIKSAATARETQTNITIVDDGLAFQCDASIDVMSIGYQGGGNLVLDNLVVFAPERIDGDKLLAFTIGSDIPYRAANILYLSSPEYIIADNTDDQLLLGTPDRKRTFPTNFAVVSGGDASRVVSQGSSPARDGVAVLPEPGLDVGTVTYFGGDVVYYPNKELFFGAVMSTDADTYKCIERKYLAQVRWVTTINYERMKRIYDDANPICKPLYQEAPYQTLLDITDPSKEGIDSVETAEQFTEATAQIAFINDNLIRGDRCVWVY